MDDKFIEVPYFALILKIKGSVLCLFVYYFKESYIWYWVAPYGWGTMAKAPQDQEQIFLSIQVANKDLIYWSVR